MFKKFLSVVLAAAALSSPTTGASASPESPHADGRCWIEYWTKTGEESGAGTSNSSANLAVGKQKVFYAFVSDRRKFTRNTWEKLSSGLQSCSNFDGADSFSVGFSRNMWDNWLVVEIQGYLYDSNNNLITKKVWSGHEWLNNTQDYWFKW